MKGSFIREWNRICSRKRILFAAAVIPMFSILFMATIFGNGKIENLPVGVADMSNTPFSRQIIRTTDASPIITISPNHIYTNESQAKEALQNMEIYGYISIPPDLSTITYYYHYALLAVGGEVHGAFVKSLGEVSTAIVEEYGNIAGTSTLQTESIISPTNAIYSSSYNSSLNYSTFLSYPFFFVFFQIFILVFTVYIIGTDLNREWLQSAKGNMAVALAGKLAPYTIIFIVQAIAANYIFFFTAAIPLQGSLLALNIASVLIVLATVSLGIAIIALIPKISIAISIASMIGALGATASGVTFPLEDMYTPFTILCSMFPIRHFVLVVQDILYYDAGFAFSWGSYAALGASIFIPLATIPLLERSIEKDAGRPLPVMWGVALVMLGGSIGYGFLYGLLYHPNIVTDIPVAVTDNSSTEQSREFIRRLNATPGVEVYALCPDMNQAKELMKSKRVKGIISIPANFASETATGEQGRFGVNQSTASFLYYLTIQQATAATMLEMNNSLRSDVVKTLPLQQQLEIAQTPTLNTRGVAIYNHSGGYGSYLLPIAIIVIIFQTMLMCGGILAGSRQIHPLKYLPPLCAGYFLLSIFLTGLIPVIFSLPALSNPFELFCFLFLFILATAAFTGAATMMLQDSEEVMLYVPFFSIGLIFLSGTSFPITQIPHFWQLVHYIFPTSAAITGYLKLNSMGGSFHNIIPQLATLAAQLLIYGTIFLLYSRKIVHLHKQKGYNP